MTQQRFELACDRLSHTVDTVLFERLRWARTEGPMLARLVALAHGAVEPRGDFELAEEASTADVKRFVLKVHSNRIIAIVIWLDEHHRACIDAQTIERSRYQLTPGQPIFAEYANVDEAWMADALETVFARVHV